VTLSKERAAAVQQLVQHYTGLLADDKSQDALREQYAMIAGVAESSRRTNRRSPLSFLVRLGRDHLDRPGESGLSYTSNWPHEPWSAIPDRQHRIWSIASVILLICRHRRHDFYNSTVHEPG